MFRDELSSLSNLFDNSIKEALSFIRSEETLYPLMKEQYFSVEIDLDRKKWILHAKTKKNILAWPELPKVFDKVQVGILVHKLTSKEVMQEIWKVYRMKVPFNTDFLTLQRDAKETFKQFLSTYIYAFGTSYKHSQFLKIFREWERFITGVDVGTHIVVLNRFSLVGMNQLMIGEHKLRRLTEEEILSLLLAGGYNQESMGIGLGNMEDGLTGDLIPEYCIEYGENPQEDESVPIGSQTFWSSDVYKLVVSSSIRLFKDYPLRTGTELQLRPEFLRHTIPFQSAYHSLLDTPYQTGPVYTISSGEAPSLSRFSESFFKIDIRKWRALLVSLRRYDFYQQKSDVEDRIIDLIIALEAMIGSNLSFGEINYKIALRCAYLIGTAGGNRTEVFDIIDLAYAVRSRIVHGDDDPMNTKKDQRKKYDLKNIYILQEKLSHYVRLVLKTMIEIVAEKEISINPKKVHESVIKELDQKVIK